MSFGKFSWRRDTTDYTIREIPPAGVIRSAGKTAYDDTDAGFWLGTDEADDLAKFGLGDSSNSMTWDGSTLAITGTLTATSGTIAGWTISAAELSNGSVKLQSSAERILLGAATAPATGVGIFLGKDGADYEFRAGDPAGAEMHWDGSILTVNGAVVTGIADGSEIGIQGWTHDLVFSATDADTVAWALGTIRLLDGSSYSIVAGNTGNMAARTYIYLDEGTSTTVLQTTTTLATAVGTGKILIATAINSTTEATFQVFGGLGGLILNGEDIENRSITATQIVANTVTANEVAANTITASEIAAGTITTTEIAANTIVAANIAASTITATELSISTLSAIAADMGTLTAGIIKMGSGTKDTDLTGFQLDSTEIVGQSSGVDQVSILASDGKLRAGGGEVRLDSKGVTIDSDSAVGDESKIKWNKANGYTVAFLQSGDGATNNDLQIVSDTDDALVFPRVLIRADAHDDNTSIPTLIVDGTNDRIQMSDENGDWAYFAYSQIDIFSPVHLAEYLYHDDDLDTYLRFQDDRVDLYAGGLQMLSLVETAQDVITLGPGSGDVDIDFNGDMFLQGSDGFFGVSVTPSTRLDIGAGAMEFEEMTAPAAGAANTGRLFCRDDGAGKTQLCVRFATGAIQVLATEP